MGFMKDRGLSQEGASPQGRDEHVLARELDELTSELRTVIPGVTVLLAFLLSLPFATGFPSLGVVQRGAYFVAFLCTALAVIFLIGEAAYHRLRGKPYDKKMLLKTATRQTVTALVLLAVALSAVVFLVADVLYGTVVSTLLTAAVAALAAATWFVLPLLRRKSGK